MQLHSMTVTMAHQLIKHIFFIRCGAISPIKLVLVHRQSTLEISILQATSHETRIGVAKLAIVSSYQII